MFYKHAIPIAPEHYEVPNHLERVNSSVLLCSWEVIKFPPGHKYC